MEKDIKVTQDSVHLRWEDDVPTAVVVRNDTLRTSTVFRLLPASAEELAALLGPIAHV